MLDPHVSLALGGRLLGQTSGAPTWTVWAVVASPVFAGLTFLLAVLVPWWHRRKAGIELRLECYQRLTTGATLTEETRLVIRNHGPSSARSVVVKMGDSASGLPVPEQHWQLPIPELYNGQEYHLPMYLYVGSTYPDWADVTWVDGRRHTVTRTIHLSLQYV